MKTTDLTRRAARSLGNARGRTILTSLAIAVGAFTLTLALAAGTGARQYADKLIQSNVDPQSVFVAKDKTLFGEGGGPAQSSFREYSENQAQYGGATFEALSSKDIDSIKVTEGVESVAVSYLVSAQYFTVEGNDKKWTTDITAYDSGVRADVAAGNLPPLGTQIDGNDIIIPESFLNKLGIKNPAELIGKKVTLHLVKPGKEPTRAEIEQALLSGGLPALTQLAVAEEKDAIFTVRAVSAKSSTTFTASSALFLADSAAKELSDYVTEGTSQYQKYITATVRVKDGTDPATVKAALEKKGIIARTAQDLQDLLFTIVNVIQGIVVVFGILALIASVFGIINTQYISVLERTREIGLMKALGMRGRHVSRLFQFEAAWIGLLGGAIGAALAWVTGILLNPFISSSIGIGDNYLLVFEPVPILLLVLGLMLVAMLAGWFPARKAARLDPIEALRTE